MKEIIGIKLSPVFQHYTSLPDDFYARRTYRMTKLEVWEVTEKMYQAIMNMSIEEFYSYCGNDAGYGKADKYLLEVKYDCPAVVRGRKLMVADIENEDGKESIYRDVMDYLVNVCPVVNIAAVSIELKNLARSNHMSVAELMRTYQDPLDLDDAVEIAEALSSLYSLTEPESSAIQKLCEFARNS